MDGFTSSAMIEKPDTIYYPTYEPRYAELCICQWIKTRAHPTEKKKEKFVEDVGW
jgi:hypothetical protein